MTTGKEKYENTNKKGGIKKMTDRGLMYITTPKEIVGIMETIPKGKVMTVKQITEVLSKKHKADFTCALTTGIFIAVIANYVEEEKMKDIPYWRVVKEKGILYEKYFRLPSNQASLLKKEGHSILTKGKNNIKYVAI